MRTAIVVLVGLVASMAGSAACERTAKGSGIECHVAKVHDGERTGMDAYLYLVPKGWTSQTSLHWNSQSYVADFTAKSADKTYMVEQIQPLDITYVNSNGKILQGIRLTDASDYLKAMVGGLVQQGKISNVKVLDSSNQPVPYGPLEQALAQPSRLTGGMREHKFKEAGFIKIEFDLNGKREQACMGTTVIGTLLINNTQLGYGATARQYVNENGTYVVGPTTFIITPEKATAPKLKEIQLIASSCQMTPKFLKYTVQLALDMSSASLKASREYQQQLNEQIKHNTERSLQNFKQQMATRDANTHEFCNYLLDQKDFLDKNTGEVVTLPTAYTHSWSNGLGDYFLTSDPTFDPHGLLDTRSNWQELEPTKL